MCDELGHGVEQYQSGRGYQAARDINIGASCAIKKPKEVWLEAVIAYSFDVQVFIVFASLILSLAVSIVLVSVLYSFIPIEVQAESSFLRGLLPVFLFVLVEGVSLIFIVSVARWFFERHNSFHVKYLGNGVLEFNGEMYTFGQEIWDVEKSRVFKNKIYVHYISSKDNKPRHFVFHFGNRSSAKYLYDRFHG